MNILEDKAIELLAKLDIHFRSNQELEIDYLSKDEQVLLESIGYIVEEQCCKNTFIIRI